MCQMSEVQQVRDRMACLSSRLRSIDSSREDLIRQLGELDTERSSARAEYRSLCTNDTAPVARLPNEVLAMIFEAAKHPKEHKEVIISHVTRRWRDVALSTPRLWTNIRRIVGDKQDERLTAYFERSKAVPVDFTINVNEKSAAQIRHFIDLHIERMRSLSITSLSEHACAQMMQCLAPKYAPALESFALEGHVSPSARARQIFTGGAPSLTAARMQQMKPSLCMPPLMALTALSLDCSHLSSPRDACDIRDMIESSASLVQLELKVSYATMIWPADVTLKTPALHTLLIEGYESTALQISSLLTALDAPALTALKLSGVFDTLHEFDASSLQAWPAKFPRVRTLHCTNRSSSTAHNVAALAAGFPLVEALVYRGDHRDLLTLLQANKFERTPKFAKLRNLALLTYVGPKVTLAEVRALLRGRSAMKYPIGVARMEGVSAPDRESGCVIERYEGDWPQPFVRSW
ncbi:hypothetical protein FIBSPDRAFT_927141 [Athelia psychrophila]|uniref:F-box domain-containing protein n=1 Tax=Athelia psychrophila TaxID=1759441 RepID=A0A166S5B2_9AGAM|nr:hypothetical protein FIBSPDRAFT_927141 [Fibularhizoctonia sp. CBS 109695]